MEGSPIRFTELWRQVVHTPSPGSIRVRRSRYVLTCLLAVFSATGIGACGETRSSGSDDPGSEIAATVTQAYTSSDPTSCTVLSTLQSVEQVTGYSGQTAVSYCQQSASDPANDARAVEVSNVTVHGDRASANVRLQGTNLDGSTITQQLVKQGGQWKLDLITAIPHFDGHRYRHAFVALGLHNGDITRGQADCLRDALGAASDSQLIALNIDPTGGTDLFAQLFGRCYL